MKRNLLMTSILLAGMFLSKTADAQLGKCKGKYFGNISSGTPASNYTTNWNQITMENASKWQSTEGTKGVYTFGGSDIGFNWAKANGGLYKYHTLMWGAQTPDWIRNASSADIQAAIPKYFKAVADHYDAMGGLKLIDVLNEPINTPVATNLKSALTAGYQAEPANAADRNNQYGWAIWCFQLARKYFPNAELLINEYNIEMNWGNCRAPYIAMSNAIKNAPNLTDGKKNLIDGIGLQAHGINDLSAANFKACLDEIWTKTGLPLHISEFDATADPNEAKQREVYSRLIPIAWEHPHVAGITLWGYIQGRTWIPGNGQTGASGTDSGIMYANGNDRPAMTWLRSYMASQPSLACCPAPASFGSCDNINDPTITFTSPLENAVFAQGTAIAIAATATDADGTIANVKFYDGTTLLATVTASPYTYSWTNASVGTHVIKAVATDNSGNTTEVSRTIKVNVPQGPYNATAHAIPGIIQAEQFDKGGNGFAYNDGTPGSETGVLFRTDEDVDIETCTDLGGGHNIGWATTGEWLEYSVNVAATGNYDLSLRVAEDGTGKTMHVEMDGVDITDAIDVPNTGGWQTWATVNVDDIPLTQGPHIMRIAFDADYVNLNYVEFKDAVVTGLEEDLKREVGLYPNPLGKDGIGIHCPGNYHYRITDLSGVSLEAGTGKDNQRVGLDLSPGVYILSVEYQNGSVVQKIIKQ